jgi:SAM-dependent methyltransferase
MKQDKAERSLQIFFEVHSGNAREGPGCFESTRRAFSALKELPPEPCILDVGCGPGRQTLDLASLTAGTIHAVDSHPPFIQALEKSLAAEGLTGRVIPAVADMAALPFTPATFDLIWSEGAVYVIGLEQGLQLWKPLLRPGGYLALTHVCWLRDDPPTVLKEFWEQAYPAIDTIAGNAAAFRRQGYELLESFVLPERAWIEEYYRPLESRVRQLRNIYAGDPVALEVLDAEDQEFALYRTYFSYYGYTFFVAQRQ